MNSSIEIKACRDMVEYVLTDLTEVIMEKQQYATVPRPTTPYATVDMLTTSEVVQYRKSLWEDDGGDGYDPVWRMQSYREGLLRVKIYGAGANAYCMDFISAMSRPDVRAEMAAKIDSEGYSLGLKMNTATSFVTDATYLLDTSYEESAYFDVTVYWVDREETTAGVIDTITVVGDNDLDGILETINVSTEPGE